MLVSVEDELVPEYARRQLGVLAWVLDAYRNRLTLPLDFRFDDKDALRSKALIYLPREIVVAEYLLLPTEELGIALEPGFVAIRDGGVSRDLAAGPGQA